MYTSLGVAMQQQVSEATLVESRLARESHLKCVNDDRAFEILGKVKALVFSIINGGNFITTDEVASFYEVPVETVRSVMKFNREELNADGIQLLEGAEYRKVRLLIQRTSTMSNKTMIWTPKSVLRVGMMLTKSPIAKAVRDAMLSMVEVVGSLNLIPQEPVQMSLPIVEVPRISSPEPIELQRMRLEIELVKARCEEKRLDLMLMNSKPVAKVKESPSSTSPTFVIEPEDILPISANGGTVQFLTMHMQNNKKEWYSLSKLKKIAGVPQESTSIRSTANRMARKGILERKLVGKVMYYRWKAK